MQNIYKRGRGNDEFTYIMTCWEIMMENIKIDILSYKT